MVIVGNDAAWSTERHRQAAWYGVQRAVASQLLPSRYDRLAEGLGAHGELAASANDLAVVLPRALAAADRGVPTLVNCMIEAIPAPTTKLVRE